MRTSAAGITGPVRSDTDDESAATSSIFSASLATTGGKHCEGLAEVDAIGSINACCDESDTLHENATTGGGAFAVVILCPPDDGIGLPRRGDGGRERRICGWGGAVDPITRHSVLTSAVVSALGMLGNLLSSFSTDPILYAAGTV